MFLFLSISIISLSLSMSRLLVMLSLTPPFLTPAMSGTYKIRGKYLINNHKLTINRFSSSPKNPGLDICWPRYPDLKIFLPSKISFKLASPWLVFICCGLGLEPWPGLFKYNPSDLARIRKRDGKIRIVFILLLM